jgi:hypothetical protein
MDPVAEKAIPREGWPGGLVLLIPLRKKIMMRLLMLNWGIFSISRDLIPKRSTST